MNRSKWALITLVVPLFGFFAYVFEREERTYDPRDDPYASDPYNVHERRRDDARIDPGRDDGDRGRDDGDRGRDERDRGGGDGDLDERDRDESDRDDRNRF